MYTVDYFIKKFTKIPSYKIGYTQTDGCAYGQCQSVWGLQDGASTDEGIALTNLMSSIPNLKPKYHFWTDPYNATPARINNGEVLNYQQKTPKQRLLAALYDIKKQQQPIYEDVTKELAKLPIDETADIKIKQHA